MSIDFVHDVQLQEATHIRFDNGGVNGTGWIRGITTVSLPVVGFTYVVEIEESTLDKELYPYSCIAVFACHITDLLHIPVADMMDEGTLPAPIRHGYCISVETI